MKFSFSRWNVIPLAKHQSRSGALKCRRPSFDWLEDRRLLSAGDPDPTFGTAGVTAFRVGSSNSSGSAATILGDGDIITVGGNYVSQYQNNFAVARLTPGGTLDSTFNYTPVYDKHHNVIGYTGGTNSTSFGSTYYANATAAAVQSDGKIIAAGNTSVGATTLNYAFALARYNADGTLDGSFNQAPIYNKSHKITGYTGGTAVTDIGAASDKAYAVAVYPTGDQNGNADKIVAVGSSKQTSGELALVRYNTDGTLDTSFGGGGIVLTQIGASSSAAYGEVIQPDGKVVVAGYAVGGYMTLARYDANGTLDASFGSGGIVNQYFGGYTEANTIAVESDGSLVAGGYIDGQAGLAKFASDGSLETGFGTGGTVLLAGATSPDSDSNPGVDQISIDPTTGYITFAGQLDQNNGGGSGYNLLAGRVDASGNLDSSFAPGGFVIEQTFWYGIGGAAIYPYNDASYPGEILALGSGDGSVGAGQLQTLVGRFDGAPLPTAQAATLVNGSAQTASSTSTTPAATDAVFSSYAYPEGDNMLA